MNQTDVSLDDLGNVAPASFGSIDFEMFAGPDGPTHAPRILLLYGSLRVQSYSKAAVHEAARILQAYGCETRIFDPAGLPQPDGAPDTDPKVQELRELALWSEGMVWCSPERHGAMTGILKSQIDWIPLSAIGGMRPTQGKTLAVMQVCGGSQSFNTVNQMRILGRWMRMITIPNQSSVPKAWLEFSEGRMKPSPYYNRIVDVMEELVRFTLMTRGRKEALVNRYSERVETAEALHKRVSKKAD